MPVKRKQVHVFVDERAKKRQQAHYQECPVKPLRSWPHNFSQRERDELQVKAEEVLKGHLGLNISPTDPQTID